MTLKYDEPVSTIAFNFTLRHYSKVMIGMDVAASELLTPDHMYDLDFKTEGNDGSQRKSGEQMIAMYKEFCAEYPIVSIEDPFDQDDWENTALLTSAGVCQVVGGRASHSSTFHLNLSTFVAFEEFCH